MVAVGPFLLSDPERKLSTVRLMTQGFLIRSHIFGPQCRPTFFSGFNVLAKRTVAGHVKARLGYMKCDRLTYGRVFAAS